MYYLLYVLPSVQLKSGTSDSLVEVGWCKCHPVMLGTAYGWWATATGNNVIEYGGVTDSCRCQSRVSAMLVQWVWFSMTIAAQQWLLADMRWLLRSPGTGRHGWKLWRVGLCAEMMWFARLFALMNWVVTRCHTMKCNLVLLYVEKICMSLDTSTSRVPQPGRQEWSIHQAGVRILTMLTLHGSLCDISSF